MPLEQLIFNISKGPQLCAPLNIVHNLGRHWPRGAAEYMECMFRHICRLFSDRLTTFEGCSESQIKDVEHGFCMRKGRLEIAYCLNVAG